MWKQPIVDSIFGPLADKSLHLNATIFYSYKVPHLWVPIREPKNESNKILTLNCYMFSPTLQRLKSDVWQVFKIFQYGGKTFHLWLNLYFITFAVYRKRNFITAKTGFSLFNFWFTRYSPLNCKIHDFITIFCVLKVRRYSYSYNLYYQSRLIYKKKLNERKIPNLFIAVNTKCSPIERHRLNLEALNLLYNKTS